MSDGRERRSTDPLIIEMYGMVKGMDEKMDATYRDLKEHMRKDEELFMEQGNRLKPVEELNTFFRVGWKIAALIFALGGLGGVGAWFKFVSEHTVPK